jgi:hypothetical protein
MARARVWLFGLIFAGAVGACMTDHAALEKMSASAGTGGMNAVAGSGSGNAPNNSGGGGVAGSGHPDDEAPGTSVLTIVQGVVDAPSVVWCFAKVAADGTVTPFGSPISKQPLAYGDNLVLHDIAGADLANDTLQPFLIAGDLDLVAKLDCAAGVALARSTEAAADPAADPAESEPTTANAAGAAGASDSAAGGNAGDSGAGAGGAPGIPVEVMSALRVRGLPAIPAGTLNGGRSYLLVANGCLGGAGYDSPLAESYCGDGYTEHAPTVSEIFVALSRATASGFVGMQFVHASLATGPISVTSHSAPTTANMPITIVSQEVEGELLPRPASLTHTAVEYGSGADFVLSVASQSATLDTEAWTDVLARGGVSALEDGSTYALVLLGSRADLRAPTPFWNLSAITVVPADPK